MVRSTRPGGHRTAKLREVTGLAHLGSGKPFHQTDCGSFAERPLTAFCGGDYFLPGIRRSSSHW